MRVRSLLLAGCLVAGCLVAALSGCTLGSSESTSQAAPSPAASSEAEGTTATSAQTRRTTRAGSAETASSASSATSTLRRAQPASAEAKSVRTVAERLRDAGVEARVQQALVRREALRIFDFAPTSVRGRVTLEGDVNTAAQRDLAARIARSVSGVKALTNEVTVQGESVVVADASSEADGKTEAATTNDSGAPDASAVYYTVESGDTLWNIARNYQASVGQIKALNDLNTGSLTPGQRIRIR